MTEMETRMERWGREIKRELVKHKSTPTRIYGHTRSQTHTYTNTHQNDQSKKCKHK